MQRLPTILFFADVFFLALALTLGSAPVALGAAVPGALVAVIACELLVRRENAGTSSPEPWRLDAWSFTVAALAVLGLGACLGPEAVGAGWLLVAIAAGLGFASLPNLAPHKGP